MTGTELLAGANSTAILFFLIFIVLTLAITWWAARRTSTADEFFAAGGNIGGRQNGVALAGDYMSAGSFLGIIGLVSLSGFDGLLYSTGWLAGWPIVLFLVAEPLRNLGKYTLTDVVSFRLKQKPVRIATATASLAVICFYLIAQMVGAGSLIRLMFGISYPLAVLLVGIVMLVYVLFGGMIATTWVQIVKAVLLLAGASLLAVLVLAQFNFNPLTLFRTAVNQYGGAVLEPGGLLSSPWNALSLGIALMFGTAGLPHILMRFYTVPDARAARQSVFWATGLIGYFYLLTFILGFGAMVLVGQDVILSADRGGNLAAPILAHVLGGNELLGFICAVAFATILAVVAGLTLSGAAALSHDLWVNVVRQGEVSRDEQLKVARIATIILSVTAIVLGLAFEGQNVAFMIGLAFALAASGNFPALMLSLFWRRMTTAGAVATIATGTLSALLLIGISPTIQVDMLGFETAWFPLTNPAIVSMPLAFVVGILVSLLAPEPEAKKGFDDMAKRMVLGEQ